MYFFCVDALEVEHHQFVVAWFGIVEKMIGLVDRIAWAGEVVGTPQQAVCPGNQPPCLVELAAHRIFPPHRLAVGDGVAAVISSAGETLRQAVRRLGDETGDALVLQHLIPVDDVHLVGVDDQCGVLGSPRQEVAGFNAARGQRDAEDDGEAEKHAQADKPALFHNKRVLKQG